MADPIASAAKTAGVPVDLFKRLITKGERSYSGWQTSPMGAAGPAQLMPGTAKAIEERHGIDTSTRQGNLLGGAYYLREQLDRFKDPRLAVAAYNAGPGAVSKYGGVPPYSETQRYVKNIFKGGVPASTIPAPGGGARPGRVGRSAPPPSGFHLPQYKFSGGVDATKLANSLLSGMSASKALEEASTPWEMHEIVQKVPRFRKPSGKSRGKQSAVPGLTSTGDWSKYVGEPEHREGPSAPHTEEILKFVGKVGSLAGTKLTPWGNESHSLMTVNGKPSAHGTGRAADIPASGRELVRLGQAALVAAGADPKWAAKQVGGLFNIGSHQVIFATTQGGNHFDHVHVGLRG